MVPMCYGWGAPYQVLRYDTMLDSCDNVFVDVGALLLAGGSDAADRRARFAVVSRDAPSADAVGLLDTDMTECSTVATTHRDSTCTTHDVSSTAAERAKLMSSSHLSGGVRWSSCESSNGGATVTEPRPPRCGPPSVVTRRGRYLAVHRYAPQNTSTGSSTSGVDVSMSSSRSELVWGGGKRSTMAALAAGCVGVTVVSSLDADCEDNCDDVVDDSLSLYRSSSFRRAIERGGGNTTPPTLPLGVEDPTADKPLPGDHHFAAPRLNQFSTAAAAFYRQPTPDAVNLGYRLTGTECSRGVEMVNPCVSPDDTSVSRAVWDVSMQEAKSQHVDDVDPFHCYCLSPPELGYVLRHRTLFSVVYSVVLIGVLKQCRNNIEMPLADCMTAWVVLRHPVDGHLGWFLWSGAADRDGGDASYWLKHLSTPTHEGGS